jgi:hypothetical protein
MKIFTLLLLTIAALLTGCAAPRSMRYGVLVDDWYTGVSGSHGFYAYETHQCKYSSGVIVNAGHTATCP